MSTEHEARARRAKAVALATVLHEAGCAPEDVAHMSGTAWFTAAKIATRRALLGTTPSGKARVVHVPHSAETVAAVERELRMLQVEQRVDVEQPRTDAGRIGQFCGTCGATETEIAAGEGCTDCGHPTAALAEIDTWQRVPATVAHGMGIHTPWTERITNASPAEYGRTPVRRATDSQGYRSEMARIAPLPEDPFAAFAGADQPHALR